MKINKRAAVTPFFTPLLAFFLAVIVGICGICYYWWMNSKMEEQEKPEDKTEMEEVQVDEDLIANFDFKGVDYVA